MEGECFKYYLQMVLNGKMVSKFDEEFKKIMMKTVTKDLFLK